MSGSEIKGWHDSQVPCLQRQQPERRIGCAEVTLIGIPLISSNFRQEDGWVNKNATKQRTTSRVQMTIGGYNENVCNGY